MAKNYDTTNETRIAQLHPYVANLAREWLRRVKTEGINVLVTQGLRTTAEQNELYAQGRTKPGKIVTNARGGYSYHNYGLALDYCLINPDGSACWTVNAQWRRAAAVAKELGFAWGGDWTGFVDYPHLEYTFGLSITQLRNGAQPPKYKEEDEPMTAAERAEIEALKAQNATILKTLDAHIEKINALEAVRDMPCPEWAKDAAEYYGPYMSTKTGSYDFWRAITIQYRKDKGVTV